MRFSLLKNGEENRCCFILEDKLITLIGFSGCFLSDKRMIWNEKG